MSLVLNVEILGEFKKLTSATQGANKQLQGLQGTAKKISSGIGRAFATIGVGLSFALITRELKEAAQAAVEDQKSQGLLATALQNTTGANNAQIASVEKSIKKMQLQASVADDEIRPAFAKLARATGDVQKSTELMSLALDIAAGTGKSLDAVTTALSRAVGPEGTTGALERLVPAIKGAKDPMAELEKLFAGSAEKAANLDPYQRMNIIFGEMQEQVGMALLPVLEKFSTWLATPEGQAKLQEIVDGIVAIIEEGIKLVAWVDKNKNWLVPMVVAIGAVTTAWNIATGAANAYKAAALLAGAVGAVGAGVGAGLAGVGAGAAVGGYMEGVARGQTSRILSGDTRYSETGRLFGDAFQQPKQNVTININKGNVTPKEIADAINKGTKTSGAPSITSAALRRLGAQ
ncbi:MAG: hypothetical protein AN484_18410 [Aphanizomenon flos-aquae WA102]|uniref:Tail tape measure protein n=1 Tax=Aphanizomenon flos-aquae WA102 TaxID=1710896 RepID=A0A1B7WYZ1_APHFL|nr:MAG: hypothetical protein AN484_18410 [Aphanizomenon flos-aquae WA102]